PRGLQAQHRTALDQHGGARRARGDDRFVARKDPERPSRDGPGRVPVSRVERRLATTGLTLREQDLPPHLLQHLHRRPSDGPEEGVAQAGQHQLDAHGSPEGENTVVSKLRWTVSPRSSVWPRATNCRARLPRTVASTGPATTGNRVVSASHW